MCDPVTLTVVAASATAAAGGFSAYSQLQQGTALNKYYQSQAAQSRAEGENALQLAEKQSNLIQDSAKEEGKQLKTQQAELLASQRAALAANGVYGVTAEDITSNTLSKQQMDELALRYNADIRSWDVRNQGKYADYSKRQEANTLDYQGKMAKASSRKEAFSTLLSTAGTVASMGSKIPSSTPSAMNFSTGGSFSNTVPYKAPRL